MVRLLSLLLVLGPMTFGAQAQEKSLEDCRFQVSGQLAPESGSKPLHAKIVARRLDTGEKDDSIAVDVEVPGEWRLTLPCSTWVLDVDDEHLWAADVTVDPSSANPIAFPVFPAGKIQVRLKPPRGGALPPKATARFFPTPKPKARRSTEGPEGSSTCSVADNNMTCKVPAGLFDFRIDLPPYVPLYSWASQVKHQEVTDWGSQTLTQGASLVGWVVNSDHEPEPDVQVVLSQSIESQLVWVPRDQLERLRGRQFSSTTNDRGFFQVKGVPEGVYNLAADKEGFVNTRHIGDIALVPTIETELDGPLMLNPPTSLEFQVEPPADHLGELWMLLLSPVIGRGFSGGSVTTEEPGVYHVNGIEEGEYRISLRASDGTKWHGETVDVPAGQHTVVQIKLDITFLEGSIRRGDEPVVGRVRFNNAYNVQKIEATIDENGEFYGILPSPGFYGVTWVDTEEPGAEVWIETIEIDPGPFDTATIEVELPDTRLAGEVVFESGEPAVGAVVRLGQEARHDDLMQSGSPYQNNGPRLMSAKADAEGYFEIEGFPAGTMTLFAELEQGDHYVVAFSSSPITVNVQDGVESPQLTLTLRETVTRSGMLWSANGPIQGATIHLWPDEVVNYEPGFMDSAITDVNGAFSYTSPLDTRSMSALVYIPGLGTRLLREPIEDGKLLMLSVDGASGTLSFDCEYATQEGHEIGYCGLLYKGGIFHTGLIRSQVARTQNPANGPIVISNFGAGEYALCRHNPARRALQEGRDPSALCVKGYLAPQASLELTLPQP